MKLVRLHLKLFRQHRDTCLTFHPGLTGIIGGNGAGKSTIVEAIAYALFGSRAIRGRVEDLMTRGASRRKECAEVQLTFEHEGQIFRVERTTAEACLYLGGDSEPYVRGTREVSERVSALLGMNHEEFIATYLTEQKNLEFLGGTRGATERERFVVRMMGYDRLEKLQELLRADRRDKRLELSGWEAGLGSREELEATIAGEEAALSSQREELNRCTAALQQSEKELDQTARVVQLLEVRFKEAEQLRMRLQQCTIRVEERSRRVSELEVELTRVYASRPVGLQDEVAVQIAELDDEAFGVYLTEMRERRATLATELQVLERESEELRALRREQRAALSSEIALRERHVREVSERVRQLAALSGEGECPTCGQMLGESYTRVRDGHDADRVAAKGECDRLRVTLQELEKDQPRELDLQAKFDTLRTQIASVERNLEEVQAFRTVVAQQRSLEQELATALEGIAAMQRELESLQEANRKLGFNEQEYHTARTARDAAQRLVEVARLQRLKCEGEVEKYLALLERSRADLLAHEERVALLNSGKQKLVMLDEADKVLTEFRRALNATLRPRLAEVASEFLSELTDGRYAAVEIAHDFTPSVLDDGEVKPIISGGEEDLLNLCVRLALSQLLAERAGQSFSLLLLDEVFGSLDETRRNNVLILLEKLRSRFEQIIVITHLDDIREGVQHLLSIHYDEGVGAVSVLDEFASEELPLAANI